MVRYPHIDFQVSYDPDSGIYTGRLNGAVRERVVQGSLDDFLKQLQGALKNEHDFPAQLKYSTPVPQNSMTRIDSSVRENNQVMQERRTSLWISA